MALSETARDFLKELRQQYEQQGFPPLKTWIQCPDETNMVIFRELLAHGFMKPLRAGAYYFTDPGAQALLNANVESTPVRFQVNGDLIAGSKHTVNISGSTIGGVAIGDQSNVVASVQTASGIKLTQQQHRKAIQDARKALVDDEDALNAIHELLYEALGQFLKIAKEIQVEQLSQKELTEKMKSTLDEVWARYEAEGLREKRLPEMLNVVGELVKHPATAEVVKQLVGG